MINGEDALSFMITGLLIIATLICIFLFSGCATNPKIGFQPLADAKVADKMDIGDKQAAGRDASKTQITTSQGLSMTDVYLLIGIALFGQFIARYISGRLLNKNNANELAKTGLLERRTNERPDIK